MFRVGPRKNVINPAPSAIFIVKKYAGTLNRDCSRAVSLTIPIAAAE
jgi:hypothetical protein